MTDRSLADYVAGTTQDFTPFSVDEAEIVAFATQFDPQPFHVDAAAAAESIYGGLIASGWHTCALIMRSLVREEFFSAGSSLGSPGIDELRWLLPVRPGDRLSLRATVLESRVSRSKPDRGIVRSRLELTNQDGQLVASMVASNFVRA